MQVKLPKLKFLLNYAKCSLDRNRTRSLLAFATVAAAVGTTVVVNRYADAVMTVLKQGAWDTGLAHMQIHAEGYKAKSEGLFEEFLLPEDNAFAKKLDTDDRVVAWTKRINFEGLAAAGRKTVYFVGIAVEPQREPLVSPNLFTSNDTGEYVDEDDPLGVVVGKGLAETLELKVGSEFVLIAQTLEGSQNGFDVHVRGIVDIPLPSFSKRTVYTTLELAKELTRLGERFSEAAIRLKDPNNIPDFIEAHRDAVSSSKGELEPWWSIQPMIKTIEKIWDGVVGFITTALFSLAGLSVANMILMVVNERTIEIGTLMAIGARKRRIIDLFAIESALVGILGGVIGLVVGIIIVAIMGKTGVPFDNPFGNTQVIVYPTVDFLGALGIFAIGIVICFFASIYPARKASSVEPVKAFRGQIG